MINSLENNESIQNTLVPCVFKNSCSGCNLLDETYGNQLKTKTNQLLKLFNQSEIHFSGTIRFLSAGASHLRDRLDFSLEEGRLGLYRKDRREVLDIDICAQLSPSLQSWLSEFRKIQWPFQKGSIRLRVGPQGQKGVWLDFANVDIKTLLDEKNILHHLLKISFVEIGQRRKIPFWTGEEYKLRDPQTGVWFQTWMGPHPIDLYCHIASFTQPSLKANKLICDVINAWIHAAPNSRVIEFGSGIGNLTLPALVNADSVLACEIDELSLQGLSKSLENLPADLQHHRAKLKIHRGDFQKKLTQDFAQFDVVLANPPRSGLMNFLKPLETLDHAKKPPFFIYMSCFPESLVKDLARLQNCGYEIKDTAIVDQFPQSQHYEVLTLLQRK